MKDAYINGKIIDGTKEMQVKEEYAILVEQGKIKDVVLQEEADLTGYNVVNLKGNYIMPGLINMHVHLAGNGKPQKKQRDNAKLVNFLMSNPLTRAIAHNMVSGFAEMELLSGVTTIRTVGGIRDFDTRVRNSSKYLEKGHKVKVSIRFKGREMAHPELGKDVLLRFAKELENVASIDQNPKLEGKFMTMILAPKK